MSRRQSEQRRKKGGKTSGITANQAKDKKQATNRENKTQKPTNERTQGEKKIDHQMNDEPNANELLAMATKPKRKKHEKKLIIK